VRVETTAVSRQDLEETVHAIGTLEALENVMIRPETSGYVDGIHFSEGDRVSRGQLLFTIESRKIGLRLEARQALLQEARLQLAQAKRSYERRQDLVEKHLVSKEALDRARTDFETARARVSRIEAEIEELREEFEDTRVRAPIDGIVGERRVDPGDFVHVGEDLAPLVNTERMEISFTVPERFMGRIQGGQSLRVHSPAFPDRPFPGSVYFVSPQIREDTRSMLVKGYVENRNRLLRPGGFVNVEVTVGLREAALVIPEEALVPTRNGYMLFVVEDSRARKRQVTTGLRQPGIVEIREGVKLGETVIRSGHISVADGVPVEVLEPALDEDGASEGSPQEPT
jgi:membrane fusion protein (multidrug efflux system)